MTVASVGTVGIAKGGGGGPPEEYRRPGMVTVTPEGGSPVTRRVLRGASYASEGVLVRPFGLDEEPAATVEILWPVESGTGCSARVGAGEHLLIPEVPCSVDGHWVNSSIYAGCMHRALKEMETA